MLEIIPTEEELKKLMRDYMFRVWKSINDFIIKNYNMDLLWDDGGKTGVYELKYRKSGKTFSALYPRDNALRILIIFGKKEREKFEESRADYSDYTVDLYDNTHQYHDGKWLYIDIPDETIIEDIERLLLIKKRPNRKK